MRCEKSIFRALLRYKNREKRRKKGEMEKRERGKFGCAFLVFWGLFWGLFVRG